MSGKKIVIILVILNIVVFGSLTFFLVKRDRKVPVIQITENGLVYDEQTTNEAMLEGVTAVDLEDGDVTDSLVVEKVIIERNIMQAIIIYGASDRHGNITKYNRTVPYADSEKSEEESVTETVSEEMTEQTTTQETTEEETTEESSTTQAEETQNEREPQETEPPVTHTEAAVDNKKSGVPVLVLGSKEVKTEKGKNPAWVTVISKLTDDKDTYEQLLGGIMIHGEFDNKISGSYPVEVSVKDTDGNESSKSNITITVGE